MLTVSSARQLRTGVCSFAITCMRTSRSSVRRSDTRRYRPRAARHSVRVPSKDTNTGAKRAREARERLRLDRAAPLDCVLRVVEEHGRVPVLVGSLPHEIAGALWREGDRELIWVNGLHAVVRQRFTLAHEYGHVCCRHGSNSLDTTAVIAGDTRDPLEVQANAFAAEFLAPRAGVARLIAPEPNLEDVVRAAAHFGISPIAALNRCRTLRLVSPERSARLGEEIDAGMAEHIGVERLDDALSGIVDLPRMPAALAGSALAGVLSDEVSVDAAAGAAGCDPATLAAAAAALAR